MKTFELREMVAEYKTNSVMEGNGVITCSDDAYRIFTEYVFPKKTLDMKEHAYCLFLSRANKVVGFYHISSGGIAGTVVDVRLIFSHALLAGACAIVLAHNHPSGNLNASKSDEVLTEKVRKSGQVLDIQLLDHLVISSEGFYSFADEGKL